MYYLPCEMTFILTYIVLNPLVLLKRSYFPFTMCLVIDATYDFAVDRFNAVFHTRLPLET